MVVLQILLNGVASNRIPITTSMGSAQGVAINLWGAKIHTQVAKVQEAGEGDGPNIPGIDNVATIELEEPASGHLGK